MQAPPPFSLLRQVLCACLLGCPLFAGTLTHEQEAWLASSRKTQQDGWILLHLEGSPRACGFQHGYLMAEEIAESLRVTKALWARDTAMEWDWLLTRATPFLEPRTDAELLAELDGLVAGLAAAGVSTNRSELLVYNAWIELSGYWWPKEKARLQSSGGPPPKRISCSAFIATGSYTRDGNLVMGHNTVSDYVDANANLVLDLVPEKGHRFVMQTAPGWLHSGTDFFVTEAGLVGTETTLGGFEEFEETGIPEFARMRLAMQHADSIDAWCARMREGNNGGYANAWLIGDVNTGEIARLELGLKQIGFERTKDGYFTGSNIAEDRRLLLWETNTNENDIRLSNVARRVRLHELIQQKRGSLDLEAAKLIEADHHDPYLEKDHPGGRSVCLHYDLDREFTDDWHGGPFVPTGAFDAKVIDASLARRLSFAGRWGSPCGKAFDAEGFLLKHPQFSWQKGLLKSRESQPWSLLSPKSEPTRKAQRQ